MSQASRAVRAEVELTRAKAEFLRAASDQLLSAAPTTSAILNLVHVQALASRGELEKTARKTAVSRPSCSACGNLLVPGSSLKTWEEPVRPRIQHRRDGKKHSARSVKAQKPLVMAHLSQCSRCNTITKKIIQPAAPSKLKSPMTGTSIVPNTGERGIVQSEPTGSQVAPSISVPVSEPQAEKKSAKARAKARKQSGLLAQLQKSKGVSAAQDDFGFGLMDFMSAG